MKNKSNLDQTVDWSKKTQKEKEDEVLRLVDIRKNEKMNNILIKIGFKHFKMKGPLKAPYVLERIIKDPEWDLLITPTQNIIFLELKKNDELVERYSINILELMSEVLRKDILSN